MSINFTPVSPVPGETASLCQPVFDCLLVWFFQHGWCMSGHVYPSLYLRIDWYLSGHIYRLLVASCEQPVFTESTGRRPNLAVKLTQIDCRNRCGRLSLLTLGVADTLFRTLGGVAVSWMMVHTNNDIPHLSNPHHDRTGSGVTRQLCAPAWQARSGWREETRGGVACSECTSTYFIVLASVKSKPAPAPHPTFLRALCNTRVSARFTPRLPNKTRHWMTPGDECTT